MGNTNISYDELADKLLSKISKNKQLYCYMKRKKDFLLVIKKVKQK